MAKVYLKRMAFKELATSKESVGFMIWDDYAEYSGYLDITTVDLINTQADVLVDMAYAELREGGNEQQVGIIIESASYHGIDVDGVYMECHEVCNIVNSNS